MSNKTDWEAIRREYEAGNGSFREIADRYGVDHTTLYRRSKKWDATQRNATENATQRNAEVTPIHVLRPMPAPSPANAVAGANLGLEDLLELIQKSKGQMDFADHVKASGAMAQYNKIIINALPDEEQDEEQEDLSSFTEEEARTYAELQERAKKRA